MIQVLLAPPPTQAPVPPVQLATGVRCWLCFMADDCNTLRCYWCRERRALSTPLKDDDNGVRWPMTMSFCASLVWAEKHSRRKEEKRS